MAKRTSISDNTQHRYDFGESPFQLWCECNNTKAANARVCCIWLVIPERRATVLRDLLKRGELKGKALAEAEQLTQRAA